MTKEEQYRRVSLALMGNKHGASNKGKVKTLESKMKTSLAMRGDKNPRWKGGATKANQTHRNSLEYREWRAAVFARDNYTCVKCKKTACRIEADHIKALSKYPKLIYKVSNGRTLCKPCHYKRTKAQLKRMFKK